MINKTLLQNRQSKFVLIISSNSQVSTDVKATCKLRSEMGLMAEEMKKKTCSDFYKR